METRSRRKLLSKTNDRNSPIQTTTSSSSEGYYSAQESTSINGTIIDHSGSNETKLIAQEALSKVLDNYQSTMFNGIVDCIWNLVQESGIQLVVDRFVNQMEDIIITNAQNHFEKPVIPELVTPFVGSRAIKPKRLKYEDDGFLIIDANWAQHTADALIINLTDESYGSAGEDRKRKRKGQTIKVSQFKLTNCDHSSGKRIIKINGASREFIWKSFWKRWLFVCGNFAKNFAIQKVSSKFAVLSKIIDNIECKT
ncbi:unnamed protein product [Allacma fusca]|uniref:Uncharacterized protein n=1 Tax=Allacma fusca TaxID=39272 RepID=A0A8J2JNW9_9HEXA|nr:unnamed protein product [Allacma fusca]